MSDIVKHLLTPVYHVEGEYIGIWSAKAAEEIERLRAELAKYQEALTDVVDGHEWHDLQAMTGLSEKRCKEIKKLSDDYL